MYFKFIFILQLCGTLFSQTLPAQGQTDIECPELTWTYDDTLRRWSASPNPSVIDANATPWTTGYLSFPASLANKDRYGTPKTNPPELKKISPSTDQLVTYECSYDVLSYHGLHINGHPTLHTTAQISTILCPPPCINFWTNCSNPMTTQACSIISLECQVACDKCNDGCCNDCKKLGKLEKR